MNEDHVTPPSKSDEASRCSPESALAAPASAVAWCLCLESDEECGCAGSATLGTDGEVTCLGCDVRLDPIYFDTGEPASGLQLAALYAELREYLD